ncbi:dihydrofolate reductase [Echinicola strongylocentroti]|uniref:Dihydrofolate reductase n=1 Tax=Echinicola strongylocentroti TaxID=1795355 RepID=A0A2Z4IRD7_9BACT|nr:dihydrofolate reductase [Echinicola strongylocentroti]
MILSIIVAKANNNVIGKDNQLIWRLSADLRHFKQHTTGHYIIMGRKTYESMGKPLPNRTSVVITRNNDYQVPDGHFVVHSLEKAIAIAKESGQEKVFVIGGAEIYKQSLPYVDEMIITEVNCTPEGDAFFPEFSPENWKKISEEPHTKDEKNQFDYTFVTYQKVNPPQA